MTRQLHYNRSVSHESTRHVWAAVTRTPCASVRAISARIGLAYSSVSCALRVLRDAGYIEIPEGDVGGARRVLVPFVEIKRGG